MAGHIQIHPGEVHLWWQALDAADGRPDVLDDEERSRAARYRFQRDGARYSMRRAFTRTVLAGYLGVAPCDVRIRTSRHGRPELAESRGVSFNVSHSNGLAVVAVASGDPVGVDVERLRPVPDAEELAGQYFTPREAEQVRVSPRSGQADAFLALWTRKESLLKAMGTGLSTALDRFDVSTRDRADLVRPLGPRGPLPYVIARLGCPGDLVGAVALKGTEVSITCLDGGPTGW
jgi:4'-phosphopantetheinyl transferase